MATPVSAYMITFNNERTIERALSSLTWADEIVVVDSFSTDRTVEIARRYTDRVMQRPWPGFFEQYCFAETQCKHTWRLSLDADEELSPELIREVVAELAVNETRDLGAQAKGYMIRRQTWYLGRWIKHGGWVPDRKLRLYDVDRATWHGGLHSCLEVDGPVREFENVCHHYTYGSISDHLDTIDRYSKIAATELLTAGKTFSYWHLIGNPVVRFARDYVIKRGFLDGFPGLVVALYTAFYVFTKHAKLWELQHGGKGSDAG